jgi:hypothetical protein
LEEERKSVASERKQLQLKREEDVETIVDLKNTIAG